MKNEMNNGKNKRIESVKKTDGNFAFRRLKWKICNFWKGLPSRMENGHYFYRLIVYTVTVTYHNDVLLPFLVLF